MTIKGFRMNFADFEKSGFTRMTETILSHKDGTYKLLGDQLMKQSIHGWRNVAQTCYIEK